MKLLINALMKFTVGLVFVGALLFLPAGTFAYMNAWLFIGLLFVPMFILGAVLFVKSRNLLEKRLDVKEKMGSQRGVVSLSGVVFIVGFVIAGLDFRFSWSNIPLWAVILFSVLLIFSYALYAEVMRENSYLSRTVQVSENQKVVDTGLYSVLRHPMYLATVIMFLSIPIVLGSLWSFLCFFFYIPLIAVRINEEEKLLEKELSGYSEYKKRVKYKMIPFIW